MKNRALFIPQIPKLSLTIDNKMPIAFTPRQFKQSFSNSLVVGNFELRQKKDIND